jgi:glucose-6-phosphate dehydrogenase assembly protein OpcA
MQESTPLHSHPIEVEDALDVQAIERELNRLWTENAGAAEADEEGAMLRARVLNLLVYVTDEESLREVEDVLLDVAAMHPCRALVMLAEPAAADKDIEMQVSTRCLLPDAGGRRLCCEQVNLRAGGRFTVELPSASVPLLVADLPVFLWWRAPLKFGEQTFQNLIKAADRVIIDTAASLHSKDELSALAEFLRQRSEAHTALSDLNWTRLTTWRALLANFYDTPEHAKALENLSHISIDFITQKSAPSMVAPKALILAGWLASRLGWRVMSAAEPDAARFVALEKDGRRLLIEFREVEHIAVAQGGLARVELKTESDAHASFIVMRAEDGRNLETRTDILSDASTARVLAGGDKSEAQLFSAELEILCHDSIYEEAVTKAAEIAGALSSSHTDLT